MLETAAAADDDDDDDQNSDEMKNGEDEQRITLQDQVGNHGLVLLINIGTGTIRQQPV